MFWVLLAAGLVALSLTALGLPGLWLFLAGAVAVKLLVAGTPLGWRAIIVGLVLAGVAEVIEFWASVRYTRRYGGSRRAGWGALLGGIVGAVMGVPVPLFGSVLGSFAGSFVGAFLGELSAQRKHAQAQQVAWGALLGRVVATGAKLGLGAVLIVVVLWSAWA